MGRLRNYQWLLVPLCLFAFWRGGVELVARTAADSAPQPTNLLPWFGETVPLLAHYDSEWYASIVNLGYAPPGRYQINPAFFPVYPLLWRMTESLTGWPTFVSGLWVAAVMSFLLCLIFYAWLRQRYSETVARHSLVALLIWPSSLFLASAYSESVFLLLVMLTFWAADKHRWRWAALAALLASGTRFFGLILWPVLIYLYWRAIRHQVVPLRTKVWDTLAVVVWPPLGLVAFMVYLWYVGAGPMAWLTAQAHWWRTLSDPLATLWWYVRDILALEPWWRVRALELLSLGFVAALVPRLWRLERGFALYVSLGLAVPLVSGHLGSLPRFILGLVPIFIVLGQLKHKYLYLGYVGVSLFLLVLSINNFVTGQWAG